MYDDSCMWYVVYSRERPLEAIEYFHHEKEAIKFIGYLSGMQA